MMLRSAFASLLVLVFMSIATTCAQEPVITAISDDVVLGSGEFLVINVQGAGVVTIRYSIPSDVSIKVEEAFREGFLGVVTLAIANPITYKRGMCELLFSSIEPFSLTLTRYTQEGEEKLVTYQCPGNITFKLVIPLASRIGSQSIVKTPISISLWSLEPWGIVVYAIFIPLFSLTAYLDLKDMKVRKAGRWSINDSIALVLRYMFYAFAISFAAVIIITFGTLVYSLMTTSSIVLKLGNLMMSLIMFIGLAMLYGVARWRGWYELIDERD